MRCVGEHIYGLYGLHTVFAIEQCQIACLCGRIAADIDDAGGCGIEDDVNDIRMHAGPWRVSDDDVGLAMRMDKLVSQYFAHIASVERCVFDSIDLAVDLCVLDGFGHILYANDFAGSAGYEVGDGACAGIQVVDQRLQVTVRISEGKVACYAIEMIGLVGIGLIKLFGPTLNFRSSMVS